MIDLSINYWLIPNTLKKTTPKDLIYLDKQITNQKKNNLNKQIKYFQNGLNDSQYQRGY